MAENSYQPAVTAAKKALKQIRGEIAALNEALTKATRLLTDFANKKTPSTVEDSLRKQVEGLQKVITKQKELDEVKKKELIELQRIATFVNKMQIEDEQRSAKKIALGKKEEKARKAQVDKDIKLTNKLIAEKKKEERAAQRVATKNAHLNRSYVKLSTRLKAARDRLQDLISTEKSAIKNQDAHNKKIRQAQKEYNALAKKANQAKKAVSNFKNTGLGGLVRSVGNLVSAFGVLGGAALFASMIKNVFTLTKTLDSLRFSMKAVITDEMELGQTERFLKQIAQDYGAELITVTNRYIKFRAASDQAGLSARETQKIFGTMTKAAGVLGLKTDELQGIFLALEQMVSKGKITTEELRRQLGERLPGAMDIMANSLGVTTAELDKMLKKGEVITKDVLPGFAKQVEIAFGLNSFNKVSTLQAAVTRLRNKWILIVEEFGKTNSVSQRLMRGFDFLADNLEKVLLITIKLIKAFVVYKLTVVLLTSIVRGYTIVIETLAAVKLALARSTNIATAAMKAFNIATKTSPAGVIIAILGAVAAAFILFKDNVSDAQKELEEFNDEVERLDRFGSKVEKSMDNIANGTLRAAAATGQLFKIEDALVEVLDKELAFIEDSRTRLLRKKEIIKQVTNQRGLDAKAAAKFAEHEFTSFSKNSKKRIAEAVIGANELNQIIDDSNNFQKGKDKEKEEFDKKAAAKRRKTAFDLEKFRILQNINANDEIAKNEGNAEQVRLDAISASMRERERLAREELLLVTRDPTKNENERKLAVEKFDQALTDITKNGNKERDKIIDAGAQSAIDAWEQAQEELSDADALDAMKADLTKAMNELADELGVSASELFAEFNKLYDWDYKNFIKFAKKKTKDSDDEGEKQKETLIENLERAGEFASELGNLGSTLFDASIQRYDDEIQKNNDFYAELLDNQLLSEEQRSAIEAERDNKNAKLEKQKRKEERKQAILNKAAALVEVAINTAIAVTKVTAQTGVLAFLTSIPAVLALGAIQAATILATPIPKFAGGKGEYDRYEGWGVWGEKRREAKISADGKVEISPKKIGDHLTYVKKDDVIHPNANKLIHQMSMAQVDMKPYNYTHPENMSSYLMMGDLFVDRMDTQTNKMVDAINKKKMSFKLNQTISLEDDIAFILSKNDTL